MYVTDTGIDTEFPISTHAGRDDRTINFTFIET